MTCSKILVADPALFSYLACLISADCIHIEASFYHTSVCWSLCVCVGGCWCLFGGCFFVWWLLFVLWFALIVCQVESCCMDNVCAWLFGGGFFAMFAVVVEVFVVAAKACV